jgi:2-C-methyl-D-erythritol 4-phosphate cytidylyltransferase
VSRPGLGRVAGLVPAAGAGLRLGGGQPKAWRPLAGRPMVAHAVAMLTEVCDLVVVAGPPGADLRLEGALVVAGGATRAESVRRMLAAVPADVAWVLVHDAARPYAPVAVAEAVLAALRGGERAVVPTLPVTDTVKRVDAAGYVVDTPDRYALRAVQTPQGFDRSVLDAAHASAAEATDDAALVEALGVRVLTIDGDVRATKITTPADLLAAQGAR